MTAIASSAVTVRPKFRGLTTPTFAIAQALWVTWYSSTTFSIIGGTNTQVLLVILWLVSVLMLSASGLRVALGRLRARGVELALLSLFVVVNVAYLILGKGDGAYDYFVKAVLGLAIGITAIVHLTDDFPSYCQVGIVVTLVLGAIATVVLPIVYLTPGIARNYEYATGDVVWFGSWGFFMGYAMTVPCLVTIARYQRSALRWVMYGLCTIMSLMILYSTFVTSILMLFAGLGGLLVLSIRRLSTGAAMVIAVVVAVIALTQLDVSSIPQLDMVSTKIKAIFSPVSHRTLDDPNNPQVRAHLTSISVQTFVQHPLFGVGGQRAEKGDVLIGNHSGIVDGLAEFGVVGLAPYLMFLAIGAVRLLRRWRAQASSPLLHAQLVMFSLYIAGSLVNPTFLDAGVMCLIFLLGLSPVRPPALARHPAGAPRSRS